MWSRKGEAARCGSKGTRAGDRRLVHPIRINPQAVTVTDSTPRNPTAPAESDARRVPHVRYRTTLTGQPALVTGANSGIGKAVALGLAAAGADVVVNYVVNPETAEEVAHAVEGMGRRAIALKADVSREDEVTAMFARAIDHFGTLHIVVSNAGLQRYAPFDQLTL
jgi:glucose 1-dehydrogenase